jgi:hypothetical protein
MKQKPNLRPMYLLVLTVVFACGSAVYRQLPVIYEHELNGSSFSPAI